MTMILTIPILEAFRNIRFEWFFVSNLIFINEFYLFIFILKDIFLEVVFLLNNKSCSLESIFKNKISKN